MKNSVLLTIVGVALTFGVMAQPNRRIDKAEERIESVRIAFITDRLRLSPEESQNFWPVYNQYYDELKSLREKYQPKKELFDMSDAEADNFIRDHLDMEQKELDLKRTFFERLRKVISPKKIAQLGRIEQQFKAKLLERLSEKRGEGPRPGGNFRN